MDNPFDTPLSGQADWDSGLSANFGVIDRGFHVTERAGQDVSSGQILSLNSGGFFFPYNPNSANVQPHAYAYTSALSGETLTAVAWGIIRSLDINSPAIPGQLMFSNGSGFLDTATLGIAVGIGMSGYGVMFKPFLPTPGVTAGYTPSYVTTSLALVCTTAAVANFTMVASGLFGWNRRLRINGTPSLAEVKLYQDSARTVLMYSTLSGGISAANSFHDRAGFPFDCDSGTIYGTGITLDSNATLTIIADWEV